MFKHLGTFAILAVCLFAIVIVMGGCNGDKDDPPPIVGPSTEETKEKTFKEQLVGSSWRVTTNADGVSVNTVAQGVAEGFAQFIGWPGDIKGTMSQNSLRFDTSGKASWTFGIKTFPPDDPEDTFEIIYALKGPYFISEDSGSSATITLSFTEGEAKFKGGGEELDLPEESAEEAGMLGDFFTDARASINGDQLRIGQMLLER